MRNKLVIAGMLSITALCSNAIAADCYASIGGLCALDDPGTPTSLDCQGTGGNGSSFPHDDDKQDGAAIAEGKWQWKPCGIWITDGKDAKGNLLARRGKPCGFMMVKNDCPGGTKPPGEL